MEELLGGRYKKMEFIGMGGTGEVYLVHDNKLDKQWAAKFVRELEDNELMALKSLKHTSLPRIVDSLYEDGQNILIMDYIEGRPLSQVISEGRYNNEDIYNWAVMLAKALSYLHSKECLYLDCKPANIIISPDNALYLVDLGSVYLINSEKQGRISGTIGYSSPEQRTNGDVDVRSDVFSYGMTLKKLISQCKLSSRHKKAYEKIIQKCTMPDPELRYQSVGLLMYDLGNLDKLGASSLREVIRSLSAYGYKLLFAMFTLIAYNTYSYCKDTLYLALATALLILFFTICCTKDYTKDNNINCIDDIHLGAGARMLPILLAGISLSVLIAYSIHSYKQISLYDESGYKVLFKGQQVRMLKDGGVLITLPEEYNTDGLVLKAVLE